MIGAGKIKQYSNVLDKPLSKGKQEVSSSAFAFLFSELVQYNQTQVDNIAELERRLEDAGYAVGARVLELLCHRDKGNRRETRLLGILSFVHSTVWKVLFGKVADSLEKGTEHEDEYMISEKELLVNRFISIPKDMGTFNCGAFVAGIVRGVLDGAGFPAVVTAHFVPMEGQHRPRTTILIKFGEEVLRREARLEHGNFNDLVKAIIATPVDVKIFSGAIIIAAILVASDTSPGSPHTASFSCCWRCKLWRGHRTCSNICNVKTLLTALQYPSPPACFDVHLELQSASQGPMFSMQTSPPSPFTPGNDKLAGLST
ncbi:41-2 PROTEIN ANTIGEN-RELATED [Salix purpurea]|uniref:41-2 PROTEIN ANTIGEN-RELATED n=1 Tax=Salix purpurea TaxID=77065 RepID=A0A9Q0ZEP3_SALPP|nr:41-2 PROTEIN ANTIGEN-RELATED [Salix purpurea]